MKLKLYHYWRSTSSWRVRWALAEKHVACEFTPVDLLSGESESPEHLTRNPLGYVPVLDITGTSAGLSNDGGRILLTESVAICEWLEETHPAPALLPADAIARAQVRQLCQIINAETQPFQNINAQERHTDDKDERLRWTQYWIRNGLKAYELSVQKTYGKYSVGDMLTLADLFLVPQCYAAERNQVDVGDYPTIGRIRDAAVLTEGYAASHPDRFKPPLPPTTSS